jgi:hypothetical protein
LFVRIYIPKDNGDYGSRAIIAKALDDSTSNLSGVIKMASNDISALFDGLQTSLTQMKARSLAMETVDIPSFRDIREVAVSPMIADEAVEELEHVLKQAPLLRAGDSFIFSGESTKSTQAEIQYMVHNSGFKVPVMAMPTWKDGPVELSLSFVAHPDDAPIQDPEPRWFDWSPALTKQAQAKQTATVWPEPAISQRPRRNNREDTLRETYALAKSGRGGGGGGSSSGAAGAGAGAGAGDGPGAEEVLDEYTSAALLASYQKLSQGRYMPRMSEEEMVRAALQERLLQGVADFSGAGAGAGTGTTALSEEEEFRAALQESLLQGVADFSDVSGREVGRKTSREDQDGSGGGDSKRNRK